MLTNFVYSSEILKFEVAPVVKYVGAYSVSISLANAIQKLKASVDFENFLAADIQLQKVWLQLS